LTVESTISLLKKRALLETLSRKLPEDLCINRARYKLRQEEIIPWSNRII